MDDVLSSIRRIIGADKRGDELGEGGVDKYYVPSLDESAEAPLELGNPSGGRGGAEPMPLDPGMRADAPSDRLAARRHSGGLRGLEPGAGADEPSPAVPMPVRGSEASDVPANAEPEGSDAMVIDEAALEDMVRRIIRDEVARAMPGEDAMRRVVHEELQGELGQRISENVQRMIQDEVSRLRR